MSLNVLVTNTGLDFHAGLAMKSASFCDLEDLGNFGSNAGWGDSRTGGGQLTAFPAIGVRSVAGMPWQIREAPP
jgi:hypothetical protein